MTYPNLTRNYDSDNSEFGGAFNPTIPNKDSRVAKYLLSHLNIIA